MITINNIVNICFKVEAKKDNGQMRAKRAENFRSRGDQSHGGGGLNILGMGGTGLHGVGQPLDGGGSPPPCPPYWETLNSNNGFNLLVQIVVITLLFI